MPDLYADVAKDYLRYYSNPEDDLGSLLVFGAAELMRDGGRMLDVGCGPGIALDWMNVPIPDYLGIDPSAPMIEEARRRHPHYAFSEVAIEQLPDRFGFDLILGAFGPLVHVQHLRPFADAVHKLLRPGGQYMLMGSFSPDHRIRILGDQPHETYYHEPDQLASCFGGQVAQLNDWLVVWSG